MDSVRIMWRKSKPWVQWTLVTGMVFFLSGLVELFFVSGASHAGGFYMVPLGAGIVCLAAAELLPDQRSPAVLGVRSVFYLIWLTILVREIIYSGLLMVQLGAMLLLVASIMLFVYTTAAWLQTRRFH